MMPSGGTGGGGGGQSGNPYESYNSARVEDELIDPDDGKFPFATSMPLQRWS